MIAAGTYRIDTEEEPIDALSFLAAADWRRSSASRCIAPAPSNPSSLIPKTLRPPLSAIGWSLTSLLGLWPSHRLDGDRDLHAQIVVTDAWELPIEPESGA